MPQLTIVQGPGEGRIIEPSPQGVVLGRHKEADVVLDSGAVSRRHVRLTWEGGRVFAEDLGSSNGTFVNGNRITSRTRIGPGDVLRIGPSLLRLASGVAEGPEMTIHAQTAAVTSNEELFRNNAGARFRAVLELAHQLGRSLDMDRVLDRLLDQVLVLFAGADRVQVLMREAEDPVVRAIKHRRERPAGGSMISRSVLRKVFGQGIAVLAGDGLQDQSLMANATFSSLGIQSLMCVPLTAQNGSVFGALQVDRTSVGTPFNEDDLYLLTAVSLMAASVLENSQLHAELLEKERLERDLAMAREIQLGYLPRDPVRLAGEGVELVADLEPALEVSGDFYDYFPLDDHRVAFAVADVSGKGMAAALFMTMVHALARHLARDLVGPADLLQRLNDAIAEDNPNFLFVTMVYGVYDARTGRATIAHAGHPPALLRRADGSVTELTHRGAPLLGLQSGVRRAEEAEVDLAPGDALLLYTDGVTESPSLEDLKELFGPHRLREVTRAFPGTSGLDQWISAVRSAVRAHSGDEVRADDITLLVLRRPSHP